MLEKTELWNLEDWLHAVDENIANAIHLANSQDSINPDKRIHWTNQLYQWKQTGITQRDDAVMMIYVLNYYSKQKNKDVMSCRYLREHSELFFKSRACKRNNWSLDPENIKLICGVKHFACREDELIRHVHPHPQESILGRDDDKTKLRELINQHLIVTILSHPGNGKTALAWHFAKETVLDGIFKCFDWSTDKRFYIDPVTEEQRPTNEPGIRPDFENQIIDSLISRFIQHNLDWTQAMDQLPNSRERERAVRKLLIEGNYLIVIDNIETTDDHNKIITFLLNLLGNDASKTTSRALVTSRKAVTKQALTQQSTHEMGGIAPSAALKFMEIIQRDFTNKLAPADCERLAAQTGYNPLFIQIALFRYQLEPTTAEFQRIMSDLQSGKNRSFINLFEPLVENVKERGAFSIAMYLARNPASSQKRIESIWGAIYEKLYGKKVSEYLEDATRALNHVMLDLKRNTIISIDPENNYTMHPLIRSYFLGKADHGGR